MSSALHRLLQRNAFLRSLDVGGNKFSPLESAHILAGLRYNGSLLKIDFYGNHLGWEASRQLRNSLQNGCELVNINLAQCGVTDDTLGLLCTELGVQSKVE